jgi:hypothetical protein
MRSIGRKMALRCQRLFEPRHQPVERRRQRTDLRIPPFLLQQMIFSPSAFTKIIFEF